MTLDRTGTMLRGICTSSTHPTSAVSGQTIYETDTKRTLVYDGSNWNAVVFGNETVLNLTTCVGSTITNASGTQDYDFNSTSSGNTRFQLSHTKLRSDTNIIITVQCTCWLQTTPGTVSIPIRVDNTTDNNYVAFLVFNEISSHKLIGGLIKISGLSTGSHTYKLRWATSNGTLTTNTGDYATFAVKESL